jgi:hypothetical protein
MNAIATTTQQPSSEMYDKISDPITAIEKMGEWIASSGMLGCTKVEQGKLIAWQCAAEKKTPFDFKREYHIIGGSLSMRSDAMLAGYRARGGKVLWKQFDSRAAIALWTYDGNSCEISFTTEDAKLAGLLPAKPGSGWAKDPSAMLRARCISKAVRMLAPEVVAGIYTPGRRPRTSSLLSPRLLPLPPRASTSPPSSKPCSRIARKRSTPCSLRQVAFKMARPSAISPMLMRLSTSPSPT